MLSKANSPALQVNAAGFEQPRLAGGLSRRDGGFYNNIAK